MVGGVAVNAYGYQRLTQDLDLVVGLRPENVRRALEVLSDLGYRPSVPVGIEEFVDPDNRRRWAAEKNMQVFPLASDRHPETDVDLFVFEPFDFERERLAAEIYELAPGIALPLLRLGSLIEMKAGTGRPADQEDVRHLRWILEDRGGPLS